jgi:hypothetical protein
VKTQIGLFFGVVWCVLLSSFVSVSMLVAGCYSFASDAQQDSMQENAVSCSGLLMLVGDGKDLPPWPANLKKVHLTKSPVHNWGYVLQVMGLSGRVQAYALTSLTSKEEAAQVMAALTAAAASGSKAAAGKSKGSSSAGAAAAAAAGGGGGNSQPLLLYVTPEKIVASKRLMAKLEKLHQVKMRLLFQCMILHVTTLLECADAMHAHTSGRRRSLGHPHSLFPASCKSCIAPWLLPQPYQWDKVVLVAFCGICSTPVLLYNLHSDV